MKNSIGVFVAFLGLCMISAEYDNLDDSFKYEIINSLAGFILFGIGAIIVNPSIITRPFAKLARKFRNMTSSQKKHVCSFYKGTSL